MNAYMEMIYINKNGDARKTGIGAAMATDAETLIAFESNKSLAVKTGDFLLDYYDASGDLVDTIPITKESFKAITGERVESDEFYNQKDADYWNRTRKEWAGAQAVGIAYQSSKGSGE